MIYLRAGYDDIDTNSEEAVEWKRKIGFCVAAIFQYQKFCREATTWWFYHLSYKFYVYIQMDRARNALNLISLWNNFQTRSILNVLISNIDLMYNVVRWNWEYKVIKQNHPKFTRLLPWFIFRENQGTTREQQVLERSHE